MASLEQHNKDCLRYLKDECQDVNLWIDEFFKTHGPLHRRFRHHKEGVREATALFGERGGLASVVHILRDCRHIPAREDYENGAVDALGLKRDWGIAAYARYQEEDFDALVKNALEGPFAILMWAFFRTSEDVAAVFRTITTLDQDPQEEYLAAWPRAAERYRQLEQMVQHPAPSRMPEGDAKQYLDGIAQRPFLQAIRAQFSGTAHLAIVRVDQLINPLAVIDLEYVEELRASLNGNTEHDIARFAVPESANLPVKVIQEASGKSVVFVSTQKTVGLAPLSVTSIPEVGVEVRFLVTGLPQFILVSKVGGRLYLRSGIHRAFLLASLGLEEIPAILVEEDQLPVPSSVYPAFAPHILALPRPPLLKDAFDPTLTVRVPLMRTSKVIKISGEEMILPVT